MLRLNVARTLKQLAAPDSRSASSIKYFEIGRRKCTRYRSSSRVDEEGKLTEKMRYYEAKRKANARKKGVRTCIYIFKHPQMFACASMSVCLFVTIL